jgi:hypothetical protein
VMFVIPTYIVEWHSKDGDPMTLRVPRDKVESLIHVLMFNGVQGFSVELEGEWDALPAPVSSGPTEKERGA